MRERWNRNLPKPQRPRPVSQAEAEANRIVAMTDMERQRYRVPDDVLYPRKRTSWWRRLLRLN